MIRTAFFLLLLVRISTETKSQPVKDSVHILQLTAPETFKARFKTSEGDFVIEIYRSWSPKGADRLYQLISTGYYNNNIVFRATPKYVQFGITDDSSLNYFWDHHPITDEPVLQSNTDSIISYATGGANNRTAQIFINMQDNVRLDTINFNGVKGFPPVGKVIAGMDVIRKFNKQYGDDIAYHYQDSIYAKGNSYLQKNFPGLDYIIEAKIEEK